MGDQRKFMIRALVALITNLLHRPIRLSQTFIRSIQPPHLLESQRQRDFRRDEVLIGKDMLPTDPKSVALSLLHNLLDSQIPESLRLDRLRQFFSIHDQWIYLGNQTIGDDHGIAKGSYFHPDAHLLILLYADQFGDNPGISYAILRDLPDSNQYNDPTQTQVYYLDDYDGSRYRIKSLRKAQDKQGMWWATYPTQQQQQLLNQMGIKGFIRYSYTSIQKVFEQNTMWKYIQTYFPANAEIGRIPLPKQRGMICSFLQIINMCRIQFALDALLHLHRDFTYNAISECIQRGSDTTDRLLQSIQYDIEDVEMHLKRQQQSTRRRSRQMQSSPAQKKFQHQPDIQEAMELPPLSQQQKKRQMHC